MGNYAVLMDNYTCDCALISDWPISIRKMGIYFRSCFFGPYSDTLYSEECQTKIFQCIMKFLLFSKPFSSKNYFTSQKNKPQLLLSIPRHTRAIDIRMHKK